MKINPLTAIDFYKADHRRQYPEGTTLVYSNFTPRSNKLSNLPDNNEDIVFFGLQFFIKEFLMEIWDEGFFNKPKDEVVAAYKRRMDTSLGPDSIPMDHIEALHDLGYLPIEIRALPEGSIVPMKIPCLTIHNTNPAFFWLVNYLESVMSCYLWKACVSATTARWYRKTIDRFTAETGADPFFCQFQGHDFSMRGMSGVVDAALSGAAHLTSFVGTDTVSAIDLLEHYYNANAEQELIGCSVPATEHSVMCMGGQEDEIGTFRRLITELYPKGIVSIVSDTWDFWKVVTEYVATLKDEILARSGGPVGDKVVIRPDSGDPVKIVCGYPIFDPDTMKEEDLHMSKFYAIKNKIDRQWYEWGCHPELGWDVYDHDKPLSEAQVKGAIQCLWDTFGGTVNDKGYKTLDPHIGLIYGDSITPERCLDILQGLKDKGFSAANVVFGIGSFTYTYVTRDTYGFAVKATYGEVNGIGREIFKDPVTDSGTKKSARGLLNVYKHTKTKLPETHTLCLNDRCTWNLTELSLLQTVFKDGKLLKDFTLSEIRDTVKL